MAEPQPALKQAPHSASVFDTDMVQIARVYATALLNAAEGKGVADEIMNELQGMREHVMQIDPRFRQMLTTSLIPRDQKAALIQRAFGNRLHPMLVDFFLVLNDHDRYGLLEPIEYIYHELRDKRARRIRVAVTTARPIDDEQRKAVIDLAKNHFKLDPILDEIVDPNIVAGMLIQVGDMVYDMTVRHRLDQIRDQLITRSKHEIQRRRDRLSTSV